MMRIENSNTQRIINIHQKGFEHSAKPEIISKQKDFWISEFSEEISVLELPADFKRPSIKGYENGSMKFELTLDETEKLKSISDNEASPMYIVLLSVYNILLSKLSNQEEVIVGMPVAVSNHVNTLPLRNCPKGELYFREFLSLLIVRTLTCLNNKSYPYEELIKELKLDPDISRNPLFDVMFLYQNIDEPEPGLSELGFQPSGGGHDLTKLDLTLSVDLALLVTESNGKLYLTFEYSTELFKKETIERFLSYFKKLISSISDNIDKKICDIEMIPENEKNQLLIEFNNTKAELPRDKTIIDLFEEQVKKTPDHTALILGETTVSYSELNTKADKIASYLQKKHGVEKEDLVGLMLEREEYLIPSIMGILKAGGVYVPIDPHYPAERKNSIIDDSKLKVLITRGGYVGTLDIDSKIIDLDKQLAEINTYDGKVSNINVSNNSLAYVIYTSGSTGNPKGVMIRHSSFTDYVLTFKNYFSISDADKVIQQSSISFDTSVEEIFPGLISGGTVIIMPNGGRDIRGIVDSISLHKATILSATPLVLKELDSYYLQLQSLRCIISGGEFLSSEYIKNLYKISEVYNTYGPSESTVCITYNKIISLNHAPLLGKPINNRKVFILNKYGHLCPILVPGELCVSGDGLARGYINNEKLTKEKFVNHPFIQGDRMYKTGDLARWLPDGNIEFLGRIDNQVKIRGFRIELGDIESHLASFESISSSTVITKERNGEMYLVAYYVSDLEISVSELRSFLSEKLPEYMVPSFYVHLENIPLTPNGKIDRKALPNPEIKKDEEYLAPSNEVEEKIAEIWSEILGIDKELISINHNFFMLGGNSLNAIKTVQKLKAVIPDISTNDIFVHPTIKQLAGLCTKKCSEDTKIKDVIEIEARLKNLFDIDARLFRYKLSNNKDLTVLFLNKTMMTNKKSFIKFIEAELDDAYQPHYIIENKLISALNDQERVIVIKEKVFFRFIGKMKLYALA